MHISMPLFLGRIKCPSTVRHWRRVTKIFPEGIISLDKGEEDITKEQNTHSVTPSSLRKIKYLGHRKGNRNQKIWVRGQENDDGKLSISPITYLPKLEI